MKLGDKVKNFISNVGSKVAYIKCDVKKLQDREFKIILDGNKKFKDTHRGERCFIVGNGPSIKQQDLSLLKDEIVFCVNQCVRNEQFTAMNPQYYVCVDKNLFNIDLEKQEDVELLNTYKKLADIEDLECFFPLEEKVHFIEKFKLNDIINTNYIIQRTQFFEGYKSKIDLSKPLPIFGTVVQVAITIAIYMGFSEIYLLGCDETGIVVTINSALKKDNSAMYSYSVSNNENLRMENMVERCGFESYCSSYLYLIQVFRRMNSYCKERNIFLCNCSAESVIDSLPRMKYEDVLSKK